MLTPDQTSQLQQCLELARDVNQHQAAITQFSQFRDSIVHDEAAKSLIDTIWAEVLAARRSSAFWQQMSDVEKDVSERLAQNHVQLQQNYLRLMQEM